MAETNAQKQRRMRQDALRDQLAAKGLVQQYLETISKMEELDPKSESFLNELSKLKATNENRAKMINKLLPDEKYIEVAGELALPTVIMKDLSGE